MTPSEQVIHDAGIPEQDRNIVRLHTNLLMNTGGGRPSDCARRAVLEYTVKGRDLFIHDHYQAHRDALRGCPCDTCQADYARLTTTQEDR